MRNLSIFLAACILVSGGAHAATMFKCVDARGKISYTDQPCAPETEQAWTSRLGTPTRKTERVPDKLRPEELARISMTPRQVRAGEQAHIEALRAQEMLRITAQQGQLTRRMNRPNE